MRTQRRYGWMLPLTIAADFEHALARHGVSRLTRGPVTTLQVNVSFFLCTDAWCQRMSDRAEIALTVEE